MSDELWENACQEARAYSEIDIAEARADERRRTLQEAIDTMCLRCGKTDDGGINPAKKVDGVWLHFYLTDYFACKAGPLHDLREKEGKG